MKATFYASMMSVIVLAMMPNNVTADFIDPQADSLAQIEAETYAMEEVAEEPTPETWAELESLTESLAELDLEAEGKKDKKGKKGKKGGKKDDKDKSDKSDKDSDEEADKKDENEKYAKMEAEKKAAEAKNKTNADQM